MTERRRLVVAVVLLAAAAAMLWTASLLVWTWQVDSAGGTAVAREVRGAQAQPAIVGLAVAVLAAVAAVLATGGRVRRAIGVLVLAGGVGALVVAARGLAEPRTRDVTDVGFERWHDEIDRWSAQAVTAVALTALAGAVLAVAGMLVLVTGHRMPRMGSRYQRSAARPPGGEAGDRGLWDALDSGRDPTDH